MNSIVLEAVQASSLIRSRVTVIHQSGLNDFDRVSQAYRKMNVEGGSGSFCGGYATGRFAKRIS